MWRSVLCKKQVPVNLARGQETRTLTVTYCKDTDQGPTVHTYKENIRWAFLPLRLQFEMSFGGFFYGLRKGSHRHDEVSMIPRGWERSSTRAP